MKVKSEREITTWLLNNGYTHKEYGLHNDLETIFNYDMFAYCGHKPDEQFEWKDEWLEPSPEDCIGMVCSVWDSIFEPSVFNRTFKRIKELEDGLHPFKANLSKYKYARVITDDDLKAIII